MNLVPAATPAIPGLQFWVAVWYLILALGVMGLVGALPWGRREAWRGREEILRGVGTVAVSVGMLLLLHGISPRAAQALLAAAVASFLMALRHRRPRRTYLSLVSAQERAASGRFP